MKCFEYLLRDKDIVAVLPIASYADVLRARLFLPHGGEGEEINEP